MSNNARFNGPITAAYVRNALTPTTYDISGGNISNSATTLSRNLRGSGGFTLDGTLSAVLELGGGSVNTGANGTPAIAIQHYNGGGYRHFIRARQTSTLANSGNGIDFFTNNSATAGGSSAPGTGNVLALSATSVGVGVGIADPQYELDVSAGTTAASVNMSSWPRMSQSNIMIVRGLVGKVNTSLNFSNVQNNTINANLVTVVLSNATTGSSFKFLKSGIWSFTVLTSHTTNNQYTWMDVSTNDVANVNFTAAGNPVIAAINPGLLINSLSWTGYLPSNSTYFYKIRTNGTLNTGNITYVQLALLYETPNAGGNFPFF
jgi:hypothetical protein